MSYTKEIDEIVNKYPQGVNGRYNFSKISGSAPLPYLVEIQKESYEWFLEKGIDDVMKEVFPISNNSETVFIDYVSCRLEEPQYSIIHCKEADLTYSRKLKVTLSLRDKTTGEIKEGQEVFMGEVPMMTDAGTFIVNGAERVIVSQIVRSPGAYFDDVLEKSGEHTYSGQIIPTRGTWLEWESDSKGVLFVKIDRQARRPATTLIKALGIDKESWILDLFGDTEVMRNTLTKDAGIKNGTEALVEIFKKLKPGEPVTAEGIVIFLYQKFFDDKRYDLGRAGRFKYTNKLGIYNRLPGRILAQDLIDEETGEIFTNKDGMPFTEGYQLTKNDVDELRDAEFFERHNNEVDLKKEYDINTGLDTHYLVNIVKVHAHDKRDERVVNIIGTDLNLAGNDDEGTKSVSRITISDMIAGFSYYLNIMDGIGDTDDIDHLGNRRIRCVGELLQTQFRIGLTKMTKTVQQKMTITDLSNAKPQQLINIRPLTSAIREFFAGGQLSQFMDQVNPLSELTNKRRLSALGPGGITRDRASMEVRDVHYTHYGRICPIETPEGQNVGLISNLSTYAKINNYGFIQTPYRKVVEKDGHYYVEDNAVYLTADDERGLYIGACNTELGPKTEMVLDGEKVIAQEILSDEVIVRHDEDDIRVEKAKVDYIDVSPKQVVSIAASCIPFLANDDSTRALMGANMQRQALPLLRPEIPYVGTGMEDVIAKDSGLAVVASEEGTVCKVDSATVVVMNNDGDRKIYELEKFSRSNNGTCINQVPCVHVGDHVDKGQVIADGPAMKNGELSLGRNALIAYMTWNGYNYEDAIIMSERMVKEDFYTTIHIESFDLDCRETKLGPEEFTRDIPNVGEEAKAFLDEDGIIVPGAEVKEGDILVGKVTPKGQVDPTPEEKLLMAIFAEKTKDGKDSSLRVQHGGAGIVLKVKVYSRKNKDQLPPGVIKRVRVYIVQKRKISEGDKMSGRHGNKGVISRILPVQDMPYLSDGTPIDVMLSPMGVPSRMNIGQIFEVHLGFACRKIEEMTGKPLRVATPAFDGISDEEIKALMDKAGMSSDGKTVLYDGRTGERFDERINVGIMYMIKLVHMVDDKLHARATGPYSLVTQQPLGGKAQNGGQRFGEMEVWALEAYGAAHVLQEMITIKSDDRVGRRKEYESIIKGTRGPRAGMPEAFKVLTKELKGLGLSVNLYNHQGETINMDDLAKQALIEERKVNAAIRTLTNPHGEEEPAETREVVTEQANEEGLTFGTGSFDAE